MSDKNPTRHHPADLLSHHVVLRRAGQTGSGQAMNVHRPRITARVQQRRPRIFQTTLGVQLHHGQLQHPVRCKQLEGYLGGDG
jgi:hypothetical protein